jgi:putative flippase GtrA
MRNFIIKFIRYFFTGGFGAVIDAGSFAIFHEIGIELFPAAASSFSLGAIVNFLLSSRFVFRQSATGKKFLIFFLAALIGLVINVYTTLSVITYFQIDARLAKIAGIAAAFFINFLINLFIVFRQKPQLTN